MLSTQTVNDDLLLGERTLWVIVIAQRIADYQGYHGEVARVQAVGWLKDNLKAVCSMLTGLDSDVIMKAIQERPFDYREFKRMFMKMPEGFEGGRPANEH